MDPYKSLLTSASREHVKRSSVLQSPLVGNVFLPAIQSPKRQAPNGSAVSPSAMSMQHLKVIEQCIQAENRREAQLAKCQSVRERRFWTRKFQAQREHERELIEALMIPSGNSLELELLDLDADAEAPSVGRVMNTMAATDDSSHRRRSPDEDASIGGLTSSVASPDRVFRKATASSTLTATSTTKPHARKKFALPECHGSPGKKVHRHHHKVNAEAVGDEAQRATDSSNRGRRVSEGQASPPGRKRSPSRSASPVRSGPMTSLSPKSKASPPKLRGSDTNQRGLMEPKAGDRDRHARVTSRTRVPPLASLPKPQASASSVRKSNGGRTPHLASRKQTDVDEFDAVTLFDGVRSFVEVQRLAGVATAFELKGEEKETQTSGRVELVDTQLASQWASPAVGSCNSPPACESDGHDSGEEQRRPHSSPSIRSSSNLGLDREGEKSTPRIDNSLAVEATEGAATSELGDEEIMDTEVEDAKTEVGREEPSARDDDEEHHQDADENESPMLFTRTSGENREWAAEEDLIDADAEPVVEPAEAMDEEELDGVDVGHAGTNESTRGHVQANDASLAPRIDEEELETGVAEVLFDLVDLVADAIEQEQQHQHGVLKDSSDTLATDDGGSVQTPPSRPSSAQSARSAALAAAIGALVRIQALFRGHNTRRAFRLALYQEALRCGMLGAMPGTVQGASGWYQDPKSLIAYYFVVDAATGEWAQRRELHCRRLVLTPFDMRSELLAAGEGPMPVG